MPKMKQINDFNFISLLILFKAKGKINFTHFKYLKPWPSPLAQTWHARTEFNSSRLELLKRYWLVTITSHQGRLGYNFSSIIQAHTD